MTAWTGIFQWLSKNNYDNGEKNFDKIRNLYRQILIDFMLFKGIKPKLINPYKGKKVTPELIDTNACAYQVQKVFNEFTKFVQENYEKASV